MTAGQTNKARNQTIGLCSRMGWVMVRVCSYGSTLPFERVKHATLGLPSHARAEASCLAAVLFKSTTTINTLFFSAT